MIFSWILLLLLRIKADLSFGCDIDIHPNLCVQDLMWLRPSYQSNFIAAWNFENEYDIVQGEQANIKNFHYLDFITGVQGTALLLQPQKVAEIEHLDKFNVDTYTISFWLMVISNETMVLKKGSDVIQPKIYYQSGKLSAYFSTSLGMQQLVAKYDYTQVWTKIDFIVQPGKATLNINGEQLAKVTFEGDILFNEESIELGGMGLLAIDELSWLETEIQESQFVKVGCQSCIMKDVIESKYCSDGYNICTSSQLASGGYQFSMEMNLVQGSKRIFTREEVQQQQNAEEIGNLLCCLE